MMSPGKSEIRLPDGRAGRAYNSPVTVARFHRIFPARRDALPRVDTFLAEVCDAAGLPREGCLRLTLLVEELFTNTVTHGYGADSDAPVWLECEATPGRIMLIFEDTAPAHDPFAAVTTPDPAAPVEDRPVGGLGVLLVSAMARQVEYRRVGDKNRISLVIGG
jgi:serine/threonine-protein kinase RsbW